MLSNSSLAILIKGIDLLTWTVQNSSIGGTPTGCYLGLEQEGVWCDTQEKLFSINNKPVLLVFLTK